LVAGESHALEQGEDEGEVEQQNLCAFVVGAVDSYLVVAVDDEEQKHHCEDDGGLLFVVAGEVEEGVKDHRGFEEQPEGGLEGAFACMRQFAEGVGLAEHGQEVDLEDEEQDCEKAAEEEELGGGGGEGVLLGEAGEEAEEKQVEEGDDEDCFEQVEEDAEHGGGQFYEEGDLFAPAGVEGDCCCECEEGEGEGEGGEQDGGEELGVVFEEVVEGDVVEQHAEVSDEGVVPLVGGECPHEKVYNLQVLDDFDGEVGDEAEFEVFE
jgi:hypothetical protein